MSAVRGVPPGRAGRTWLSRRVRTAQHGASLLDRKLRILQAEAAGLRESAAQAAAEWDRSQASAGQWLLRAGLLEGQRAIRLSASESFADVTISYASTMGVRFPARTACAIPPAEGWDSPAVTMTRRAHRAALAAAVRHAAAAEAVRVIEAEALATRYRLHAVRDRWIPRLEQALTEVIFAIEEQERADSARLRLAAAGQESLPRRYR